jgi:hypothetical protein
LLASDKRYTVINRFAADKTRLRFRVRSLNAGWDGIDYEQAMRAQSLLSELKTAGKKDRDDLRLSGNGWNQANATFKPANDTQLTTLDVTAVVLQRMSL